MFAKGLRADTEFGKGAEMAEGITHLIINSPYEEPVKFWRYKPETKRFILEEGSRRPAGYVMATPGSRSPTLCAQPRRRTAESMVAVNLASRRPRCGGISPLRASGWPFC